MPNWSHLLKKSLMKNFISFAVCAILSLLLTIVCQKKWESNHLLDSRDKIDRSYFFETEKLRRKDKISIKKKKINILLNILLILMQFLEPSSADKSPFDSVGRKCRT